MSKTIRPLKITFHLDGTGALLDPSEPIHIDGLLAWALAPLHRTQICTSRSDVPDDIPLPLGRWQMDGAWGWSASALLPVLPGGESLQFWRKKFRTNRMGGMTKGSPNLQNGTYREHNAPMPLTLCTTMVGYAMGDRSRIKPLLRAIKYLGKKRAIGKGKVVGLEIEHCEEDWTCFRDGKAMRWLPMDGAPRLVRPRPPYWNMHGAIPCAEIGMDIKRPARNA